MTRGKRLTRQRVIALQYIADHPGVTIAQLDRARRTARGGHAHMYALVWRMHGSLVRFGSAVGPGRYGLYLTDAGKAALALASRV